MLSHFFRWRVHVYFYMHWNTGRSYLLKMVNQRKRVSPVTRQPLYRWRHWFTPFLLHCRICFIWWLLWNPCVVLVSQCTPPSGGQPLLFTMVMEYIFVGQKHSLYVVCSVAIIILGALVAGARDLSFDSYSYTVVFMSNICTAIYLASVARVGKSSGLNSFGLMWCNGLLCGPILLCWTFIRGDLELTMNFPYLLFPGFQVVMLLSCILAFLLNYSVFLNTTLNSALTQTICGNLKDLFTIGIGWLLFGGLPFDLLNVIGQSLGFLGSCFYAYCKLKGK